jgi:hypothetical protein
VRAAALLLLALPLSLAAQRPRIGATLYGSALEARSVLPGAGEALSGNAFGGEGRVLWRRLTVAVGYGQGSLDPDTAGPAARDYVEGYALLGGRVLSWLELRAGPHARAYVTPAGTQRWLFWELRARFDAPVVTDWIRGHAELWGVVSGSVNVAESFGSARGGTAGVTARLGGTPLWARLQYGIDEARLANGTRRETVEALTLALGVGGW